MASVRYRKRGDSNLWTYEIRNEGKTVAHNSGFKTKTLSRQSLLTHDRKESSAYNEGEQYKSVVFNRALPSL